MQLKLLTKIAFFNYISVLMIFSFDKNYFVLNFHIEMITLLEVIWILHELINLSKNVM